MSSEKITNLCSDKVLWLGLFLWTNVTLPTGKVARLFSVPFRCINDPYADLPYDVFFHKWRMRLSDFFFSVKPYTDYSLAESIDYWSLSFNFMLCIEWAFPKLEPLNSLKMDNMKIFPALKMRKMIVVFIECELTKLGIDILSVRTGSHHLL